MSIIKGLVSCRVGSSDFRLFVSVVNQGIDSHLEAFTKSRFPIENGRLSLDVDTSEVSLLVRRLREIGAEEADSWADDIEASV